MFDNDAVQSLKLYVLKIVFQLYLYCIQCFYDHRKFSVITTWTTEKFP